MLSVIKRIEAVAFKFSNKMVWSNVYGLARTLLAIGTLLTLIFNDNSVLFGSQQKSISFFTSGLEVNKFTLFYFLRYHLVVAKSIAILILLIVASGWRPRLTCLFHWYIAISFELFCVVPDGGDQVTSVLAFLLIPICLLDNRKWQWDKKYNYGTPYKNLIAYSTYWIIRIQVAVIYLDAATEKFKVSEWTNGTILWFVMNDPIMGFNNILRPILLPVIKQPFFLGIFSWSVLILEFSLFLGLGMDKVNRKRLLIVGILFHLSIVFLHGLISFFFAMTSALILYLQPWEQPFLFLEGFNLKNIKFNKILKR